MKIDDYELLVANVCQRLFGQDISVILTRPDESFGDLSTNVAMQLAAVEKKSPLELAKELAKELNKIADFEEVSVAGPGFINIRLVDTALLESALNSSDISKPLLGKTIVAEYSDPNPFKTLHVGHLYTSLVGDSIARIVEAAGAKVHRVNFGGDVGLHVAKTMWAIIKDLGGENPDKLKKISESDRLNWLSECYVLGSQAYEKDKSAKDEIVEINRRVYEIHNINDKKSLFAQIYWTTRQWSYDGFEKLYKRLGMVKFEKYYPESQTTNRGVDAVKKGLKNGIFQQSDGAVVFDNKESGLHTRVFLNSEGLPTYEAKDLGLALIKWDDFHFDESFIITGDDIKEYMRVVIAAVSHFNKDAAKRTTHLTHGQIKMAGGKKMSSRHGNILLANDIIDAAYESYKSLNKAESDEVVLGAIRYSFIKDRIIGDSIYDPEQSVSIEGNSGPYLQYALVRARSILKKVDTSDKKISSFNKLTTDERSLARKLSEYPDIFALACKEMSPHHICNYLYVLSQTFNRFYESSRVIDHDRSKLRARLVEQYEQILSSGLEVLGMPRPEKL